MFFIFAIRQGTDFQISYRFVVKNLPKKTILDKIGWYRSGFYFRKDMPTTTYTTSFLCLNIHRLSF